MSFVALMLIVGRAGDVPHTEALSTMTQSIGYALGPLGPLAVGASTVSPAVGRRR